MRPIPEQIEKAGYWFNKNIRARKTVEQLSTAYVLAAYAAQCVAEAIAEHNEKEQDKQEAAFEEWVDKHLPVASWLINEGCNEKLAHEYADVIERYVVHRVAEATAEKDAEIARLRDALKPFTYMHDPDVEGDPLEGLPDGHGFIITSTLNEDGFGCGACNITAGQIRRARAALQETKPKPDKKDDRFGPGCTFDVGDKHF